MARSPTAGSSSTGPRSTRPGRLRPEPRSPDGPAIMVASGVGDSPARPDPPGPVRGPAPVLVLGQHVVSVVLQEQLHEHRVHLILLTSAGPGSGPPRHPQESR